MISRLILSMTAIFLCLAGYIFLYFNDPGKAAMLFTVGLVLSTASLIHKITE